MKHRGLWLSAVLAGGILAAALTGCASVIPVHVTVMVEAGEGYTVKGRNPVTVEAGGDAVFELELADGYVYLGSDSGASYENGRLTLSHVLYPTTLSVSTIAAAKEACAFSLHDMTLSGTLQTTLAPGTYPAGSAVTVSAVPHENYKFTGWSLGATIARGGKLLTRDAETTLTLTEDVALYANFATSVGVIPITYNANGGVHNVTGEEVYIHDVDNTFYLLPSTLPSMDHFSREGYMLLEYNTKADGTGDAYSLGSKVIPPKDGSDITLYCIWAKESDASLFKTVTAGGTLTITSYTGDEDTVVIPERIGGKEVTAIAAGAIKNKKMTTLVLPKSIETVAAKAIENCDSLDTLYMHDNITSIPNEAIVGRHKFRNFRLNAARLPAFANQVEGDFCIKWERLVASDKPAIVVLSGSSSLNGLNSPMMDEAFEGKYEIVNYGTNAGVSGVLYMEFLANFMEEGDILISAPEMSSEQGGATNITWRLFRGTELYYNVFRYVDISRYSNLFSELTAFNRERANIPGRSQSDHTTAMNEYGDLINGNRDQLSSPKLHHGSSFGLSTNTFAGDRAKNLNWAYSLLTAKGVTVYFSCAPFNANGLTRQAREESAMDTYNKSLHDNLNVPVISRVQDYALAGEYIYDSDWHPNFAGSDIRTTNLINDMKAQMQKDGIWP